VWHLVGGLDPIGDDELTGSEPNDGYPALLRDWIEQDGLDRLKIDDPSWLSSPTVCNFIPKPALQNVTSTPGSTADKQGILDGSTLSDRGFGYRVEEIARTLPDPVYG